MPDIHAKLSASGAKKWIACPGSVVLEGTIRDKPSEYASEGTAAHALGEAKIRLALKEYTKTKYKNAVSGLNTDEEMEDYTDEYRDFVLELYNSAKRIDPDAILVIEHRVDFSKYVPEGFGTADCLIIGKGFIDVIDFKYGKGVPVQVENNPQMMLYALGAIEEYDFLYDIEEVDMFIFQPRINNISNYGDTVSSLKEWGESIKPIARKAFDGVEEYCSGSHCDTGFCKARPICRAYAEQKLAMARFDFAKPTTLSPDEIAEILDEADALAKWATLIKDYALDEALHNGTAFPGYKVVEGRSNRAYAMDDSLIAAMLIAKGYNEDDICPRKLKTVTNLEKYLGKKEFNAILGEYIVKPAGKPTLVPETDKRPAFTSIDAAMKDFENVNE